MSGFVIDASVALAWCFDDEATEATRALLDRFEEDHAQVPSLWHLELANALALGERKKRITPARTAEFIALVGGLPIVIDEQTPNYALGTVLELARSEAGIPISADAFDADPWLLTCANGTIDLRTGSLRAHSPADLKPGVLHGGLEYRQPRSLLRLGRFATGRLVAGLDAKAIQDQKWQVGWSMVTGVELGDPLAPLGSGRRWSVLLKAYTGPAPYGQFYQENVRSVGVGVHFDL